VDLQAYKVDTNILKERTVSENPFGYEDGTSMFLRNVGIYQQIHTALNPEVIHGL
jgi:hypothetical protein